MKEGNTSQVVDMDADQCLQFSFMGKSSLNWSLTVNPPKLPKTAAQRRIFLFPAKLAFQPIDCKLMNRRLKKLVQTDTGGA